MLVTSSQVPMQDVVRSSLQTRIISSLRRYSFAGDGLPERMRSTAFAFLGLTAAMGLALVAIFAQINFSVLSPAPPPSGPSADNAVSEAIVVDHRPRPGITKFTVAADRAPQSPAPGTAGVPEGTGSPAEPGGIASPASPPAEPGGGPSGGESVEAPSSDSPSPPPAGPAPAPAQTPAVSSPEKPTPTPARPATPTPAPAPGNSQSTAAAAHASERGVEASSKQSTESSTAGATTSATESPAESSPGNGNGKALGHTK